jgi:hypothetical protein
MDQEAIGYDIMKEPIPELSELGER